MHESAWVPASRSTAEFRRNERSTSIFHWFAKGDAVELCGFRWWRSLPVLGCAHTNPFRSSRRPQCDISGSPIERVGGRFCFRHHFSNCRDDRPIDEVSRTDPPGQPRMSGQVDRRVSPQRNDGTEEPVGVLNADLRKFATATWSKTRHVDFDSVPVDDPVRIAVRRSDSIETLHRSAARNEGLPIAPLVRDGTFSIHSMGLPTPGSFAARA